MIYLLTINAHNTSYLPHSSIKRSKMYTIKQHFYESALIMIFLSCIVHMLISIFNIRSIINKETNKILGFFSVENKKEILNKIDQETKDKIQSDCLQMLTFVSSYFLIELFMLKLIIKYWISQNVDFFSINDKYKDPQQLQDKNSKLYYCNYKHIISNTASIVTLFCHLLIFIITIVQINKQEWTLLMKFFKENIMLTLSIMLVILMMNYFIKTITTYKRKTQQSNLFLNQLINNNVEIKVFNKQQEVTDFFFKTEIKKDFLKILEKFVMFVGVALLTFMYYKILKNIVEITNDNHEQKALVSYLVTLLITVIVLSRKLDSIYFFIGFMKVYQSNKKSKQNKHIINNIQSIQIKNNNYEYVLTPGNIYRINGPSGVGKTSIINKILQIPSPFTGQITVNSHAVENIDQDCLYRRLSIMRQQINLIPEEIDSTTSQSLLQELQNTCNFTSKGYGKLSGGEKQKMAILRALRKIDEHCNLLILDEPFSALDQKSIDIMFDKIIKILNDNLIIIIIDHTGSCNNISNIKNIDIK